MRLPSQLEQIAGSQHPALALERATGAARDVRGAFPETSSATRRYLLVSPCRDEAAFLRRTLDAVAAQTLAPSLWVVVDDGSTDDTPRILEEYARALPYLFVVRREDRGRRQVGPGVVEAFYAGLEGVDLDAFQYLCKLDMDLDLPPRYFELLVRRMEAQPRLGTCSGKPWFVHPRTGALVPELCGDEMSVGMTKFYRVACFREIGGFVRQVMWDGIDCHRARMLGWIAESVDDEALRFVHLRPQGASHKGIWTGRVRAGFGQYFMGTSSVYYLAAALRRLPEHPAVIGSAAMLWGYASSAARRALRYGDPEFRRWLRRYQRLCLLVGKRAATTIVDTERAPSWYATHGEGAGAARISKPVARTELMGLPFDRATMRSAVEQCLAWCTAPRAPHTVITANAATLCMTRHDPQLRDACRAGDLVVADGMSVVWTSRASAERLPERVAGVDLMQQLLEAGAPRGLRVYFLGARAEVVARIAEECGRRYPGLVVAGFRDGYFTEADSDEVVDEVRRCAPDVLFVGMPSPFKETWCERHRHRLDVPVIMGVGGSFDVLAGYVRRAPPWMRSAGLEWAWRLLMEPRRMWKRYLTTNVEFLWLAAREIAARALGRRPSSDTSIVRSAGSRP